MKIYWNLHRCNPNGQEKCCFYGEVLVEGFPNGKYTVEVESELSLGRFCSYRRCSCGGFTVTPSTQTSRIISITNWYLKNVPSMILNQSESILVFIDHEMNVMQTSMHNMGRTYNHLRERELVSPIRWIRHLSKKEVCKSGDS